MRNYSKKNVKVQIFNNKTHKNLIYQIIAFLGFSTPGEPDSDYDRWYPQNFEGKKCLFGYKVSYLRKKTDS